MKVKAIISQNQVVLVKHEFTIVGPGDLQAGISEAIRILHMQHPGIIFGWSLSIDKV